MVVNPAGDVGGVGRQPEVSAAQQAQDTARGEVTVRVFAMLMSILGTFADGVVGKFLPRLAQEETWEHAASGVYFLFSISPGTPPTYSNGQLTPKELSIFGNGWEWLKSAYEHPKGRAWKSMPPNLRSWATAIMKNPTISAKLNGIYGAVVKLQQLQNEGKPWKAQYHKVLADVVAFQKLGTGKDTKMVNAFDSLRNLSRTTVAAMSAISNLTYATASGWVLKISAISRYSSQLIAHNEKVKSSIVRSILS